MANNTEMQISRSLVYRNVRPFG